MYQSSSYQNLMGGLVPTNLAASDGAGVNYELGLHFKADVAGKVVAIRFYKSASESGTHTGHLWTSTGTLLATVTFSSETASGWQKQALATPIDIKANTDYVVSVNTGNSYYVATTNGLATSVVKGDLSSVVGNNGAYGSVGTYPTQTWNATNYFRDVVFMAGVSPSPSPSPTPTPTPTPSPSPSPSPTGTPGTAFYIRSGATGDNSGRDWANACPDFAGSCDAGKMVRGATYYVAGGTYPSSINFNTPDSGTSVITIKGATAAVHGTGTGWSNSYSVSVADGGKQAVFSSTPSFYSDYWVFDGSVGTGQSSQSSPGNFGFARHDGTYHHTKPTTPDGSMITGAVFNNWVKDITIAHYEVDGVNWDIPNDDGYTNTFWVPTYVDAKGNGFDCVDNTTGLTFDHDYIHDQKGSVWVLGGNLTIQNSSIVRVRSTGANHGEGVASRGSCPGITTPDHSSFHHNYWVDVLGTGSIVALINTARNWEVYSNVFYATGATCTNCNSTGPTTVDNTNQGFIIGLKYYNNTVFNMDGSCGPYQTNLGASSGFDVQNNIFYDCSYGLVLSGDSLANNLYWNSYVYFCDGTGGCPGKNDSYLCGGVTNCFAPFNTAAPTSSALFVSPSSYNLRVNGNTIGGHDIRGANLGSPYNIDMDGKTRLNWTRGAFEY